MNLKEIEYIVTIAEEGTLTRAAEKLFITPSALTQQLVHLEKEIGMPLFIRSRNGWTPTDAGEIYLKTAKEMLNMKRETYKQLQDIAQVQKGILAVGFPPDRGASMFTTVYPAFHKEYPNIRVNVYEASVRKQQQMIAQGELDVGFLTLCDFQMTDDKHIFIGTEELLLAAPSIHPLCANAVPTPDETYPEIELNLFRHEPFARIYKESTIRSFSDSIFQQAGFLPAILFETSSCHTILEMVNANLCCGLVPSIYARNAPSNVTFFSLPTHPTRSLAASYKKGSYLSLPARYFIHLAAEYWR